MEYQFKKISELLSQLNNHITIINNIINEMNQIMIENSNINSNLNNSINSLYESTKKINQSNYNNIFLNNSFNTFDKESPFLNNNLNDKINVTFKNLGKERNFVCDSNTPIYKILRAYLEETGSLKMPKKPIFIYKGCSLNPNDKRKIGEVTKNNFEITVDYF